jgi:hypothetical protein
VRLSTNANGRRGSIGLALAILITGTIGVQSAHAGTWMQVSCVNPDGSAASSDGWSTFANAQPAGSSESTQCGPGTPMVALVSDSTQVAGSTVVGLQYTAPSGSALSGGTVDVNLDADGTGMSSPGVYNGAEGQAGVEGPALGFDADNVIFQCVDGPPQAFAPCQNGTDDFVGALTIPNRGGGVWVDAACGGDSNEVCNTGGKAGAWAQAKLISADLLLTNGSTPQGTNLSGSALQPGASGTAHVVFTATDPGGPGVYQVTTAVDGKTVYTGTPDSNGGHCLAAGTDPGTGALMFDFAQPCPTTEVVDAPVPTAGLADGAHDLTVTLTDAARNSSTVFDQTITTSNPQTTPNPPSGPGRLHARFVIKWRWLHGTTRVRAIRVTHLPGNARVAVACAGRHCPHLRASARGIGRVQAMLAKVVGRRLHPGQSLLLTVTAPHHKAERIALVIRNNRKPLAKLLP